MSAAEIREAGLPPGPGCVRPVPGWLLCTVFVLWLGSATAVLWQMDTENRLRGTSCTGAR
jgi:hypothetical protein